MSSAAFELTGPPSHDSFNNAAIPESDKLFALNARQDPPRLTCRFKSRARLLKSVDLYAEPFPVVIIAPSFPKNDRYGCDKRT